jgi:CHASE3 domain sensor protein
VKIGRRLVIVFGIIGAILLTVGAGALWSQREMSQANRASLDELEISNLVGQFTSELFAVRLVLPAIIISTDAQGRSELVEQMKTRRQRYQELFKQIRSRIKDSGAERRYSKSHFRIEPPRQNRHGNV